MRVRNWGFNLLSVVGAVLFISTITIGAQLANGSPQPLTFDQLQAVTGGGDCENCGLNTTVCKTENEETCKPTETAGEYGKRVWTGQDEVTEKSGLDSGVMDAAPNTPEKCFEIWTGCDKQNGSCVNCDSTSTTGTVNSNCHFDDASTCPAS